MSRIRRSLHFADEPTLRAPKCPVLESGPAGCDPQSLHVSIANRAAGADDFPWRKLVGELSIRHAHSLIAGGSTTLSVTDRCHEPLGNTLRVLPINIAVHLKCARERGYTPLGAPRLTHFNPWSRSTRSISQTR